MSEIKLSGNNPKAVSVSNSLARYYSDIAKGYAEKAEVSEIKAAGYLSEIQNIAGTITIAVEDGKLQLSEYTDSKKLELDNHTEDKKVILNSFTEEKKTELEVSSETLKGIFDTNYVNKTNDFNTNAANKQIEVDNSAKAAKLSEENAKASETASASSEANAKKYANGTIEEYPEGSSKYYAEKAAEIVGKGVIQDDKIALDTTYSSKKIEERLEESGGVKTLPIHVNPIQPEEFYVDNTAEEIRRMVYEQSRDVRLSFEDTITNTGEQLYDFETFDKQNYAVFRRNVIDSDTAERINIKVGNDKKVTFNITPYNGLLTDGSKVMTGALKFEDSGYIEKNNSPSTKGLALFGDKDGYGTGASIALRSNLASGSQAGAFKLETGNNITGHTHTLQGSPDGSFTCDGKEIIRSINGEVADSTGNIEVQAGGGLEIADIGTALFVDETQGLRRILNGQLVAINTNTQAFLDRLKVIKQNYPQLFTTEDNWQVEKALSQLGQCGKFVIDEVAGTIRIPAVVNIQGALDLSQNGLRVEAGLPDHTHAPIFLEGSNADAGDPASRVVTNNGQINGVRQITNSKTGNVIEQAIYGKSTTVQQEAIQYIYFIQIATGQETKADIKNELQLNNPFTFGIYQFTDCELNNLSWLRSQGQWNNKTIYPDFYTWLLQIQSGQLTVAGVSVKLANKQISTFAVPDKDAGGDISPVLPPDGELTEGYTDFDYVLNTSDETFRLPIKVKGASSKAVAGNGMTLGITDGANNAGLGAYSNATLESRTGTFGKQVGVANTGNNLKQSVSYGITTDSAKSGIETSADGMYLYFYVGETVQNANLVNIGRLEEKLSGMVDCDVVIESKVNPDGSWYRKWGDGWLEQGGIFPVKDQDNYSFTFPKPFLNTNYHIDNNTGLKANSTPNYRVINIYDKTTTGAKVYLVNGVSNTWYACGQGV